jgi:hypothetical protein
VVARVGFEPQSKTEIEQESRRIDDVAEYKQPRSADETPRTCEGVAEFVAEFDPAADVSDADVERAIVRAVLAGRDELAEELRAILVRRRHARAGVVELEVERSKRGR